MPETRSKYDPEFNTTSSSDRDRTHSSREPPWPLKYGSPSHRPHRTVLAGTASLVIASV